MGKNGTGVDQRPRSFVAIDGAESEERSEIRRKRESHFAAGGSRPRATSMRAKGARTLPTRRSRPAFELLPPLGTRESPRARDTERLGRRLRWMSVAYAGYAAYVVGSGLHPMAPPAVVALASASSAGLVAMMASRRMISEAYAVVFGAVAASAHAWAQACVAPGGGTSIFALTALGGVFLFEKTSHVAVYVGFVTGGFLVALAAFAVPEAVTAWVELASASAFAMGVVGVRATRAGATSRRAATADAESPRGRRLRGPA